MEACKKVYLKNYFNFEGRASRSEFWWAYLGQYAVTMVFYMISMILCFTFGFIFALNGGDESGVAIVTFLSMIPMLIVALALTIPFLGVSARRLHDIGKSGWWHLINFIPVVGQIIFIVFMCKDSTEDNQWGPNPKIGY